MPNGGIKISATIDVTILPNAAPMIRPTAMSSTLPRMANSLNSFSITPPLLDIDRGPPVLSLSTGIEGVTQRQDQQCVRGIDAGRRPVVVPVGDLNSTGQIAKNLEANTLVGRQIKVVGVLQRGKDFVVVVDGHLLI